MINVTYTSKHYAPEKILRRYVRRNAWDARYQWCEVGADRRFDLRQGECDASDLPKRVAEAADEAAKVHIHYVDWPI